MDHITLDREAFKALASDTRLDILKALDVRQKTVTELAKEFDLNKATVFEHLEKLTSVGLVQKLEDERKWVYYQLTWKGRRLLHPEKITIALLLSSGGASALTGAFAFYMWWQSRLPGGADDGASSKQADAGAMSQPETLAAPAAAPPDASALAHDPVLLWTAVVLLGAFVAFMAGAAYMQQRARKRIRAEAAEAAARKGQGA